MKKAELRTLVSPVTERRIGYAITPADEILRPSRAIVLFVSLSGNCAVLPHCNLRPIVDEARSLCVDRPGCGETSNLPETQNSSLDRIQTHAQDVLEVLRKEQIDEVWILGVCIGHPFAIETARLLGTKEAEASINVRGISLVAPFVSTDCSSSWSFARLGTYIPSSLLYASTEMMAYFKGKLLPYMASASAIEGLVTDEEREHADWRPEDYQAMADLIVPINQRGLDIQGEEARLGVDGSWQTLVIDQASKELKFQLPLDETSSSGIPIRIHAIRDDKIAPFGSIQWVAERCYGGRECIIEESNYHSHATMTFLGGPIRNPTLLYKIAEYWGLMKDSSITALESRS